MTTHLESPRRRAAVTRLELLASLGVIAVAGWLLTPVLGAGRAAERRAACLANLDRIGTAIRQYLEENRQRWPCVAKLASFKLQDPPWPTLPTVLRTYTGDRTDVFHCPADRRVLPADSPMRSKYPSQTTWFQTEGTSYEWLWGEAYGGKKVGEESLARASGFGMGRADQPLMADFEPFHTGDDAGSFNTLHADLKARTSRSAEKN